MHGNSLFVAADCTAAGGFLSLLPKRCASNAPGALRASSGGTPFNGCAVATPNLRQEESPVAGTHSNTSNFHVCTRARMQGYADVCLHPSPARSHPTEPSPAAPRAKPKLIKRAPRHDCEACWSGCGAHSHCSPRGRAEPTHSPRLRSEWTPRLSGLRHRTAPGFPRTLELPPRCGSRALRRRQHTPQRGEVTLSGARAGDGSSRPIWRPRRARTQDEHGAAAARQADRLPSDGAVSRSLRMPLRSAAL